MNINKEKYLEKIQEILDEYRDGIIDSSDEWERSIIHLKSEMEQDSLQEKDTTNELHDLVDEIIPSFDEWLKDYGYKKLEEAYIRSDGTIKPESLLKNDYKKEFYLT
jgi:hypothetical protein